MAISGLAHAQCFEVDREDHKRGQSGSGLSQATGSGDELLCESISLGGGGPTTGAAAHRRPFSLSLSCVGG